MNKTKNKMNVERLNRKRIIYSISIIIIITNYIIMLETYKNLTLFNINLKKRIF